MKLHEHMMCKFKNIIGSTNYMALTLELETMFLEVLNTF